MKLLQSEKWDEQLEVRCRPQIVNFGADVIESGAMGHCSGKRGRGKALDRAPRDGGDADEDRLIRG